MHRRIDIYDSTLRDGAQGEGISFSVLDKINIVKALDEIGVAFIEAGNPGSNPKDLEFFEEVKHLELKNAKLVAFGATRRRDIRPEEDANLQSLLIADTEHVAIFGKSWDFHVTEIINTTLEENLRMIQDTIRYMQEKGKKVVFDAEHFYDGYKNNREYALATVRAAAEMDVHSVVLCDTNGGTTPMEIYSITREVCEQLDVPVGIHCHDDSGTAVANSLLAVEAGAQQVQGTFVGFGERCGNANLAIIIGGLQLKKKFQCIPEENMELLTPTARLIAEIANIRLQDGMAFVGKNAFAHKGGMHIDGVNKASHSFEHIPPEAVGNERRFLMSEVSGRSTILKKINKIAPEIQKDSPETIAIINRLKELEHEGYQFEGAESTFELVIRKHLGKYKPFFELENFKIMNEKPAAGDQFSAYAMVKVRVEDAVKMTAAEGDGPVNALDKALREALEGFYPILSKVALTDYKVRVLDTKEATAAKVRVLITSSDGERSWTTVGVSTDIIEASLTALVDSIEIKLIRDIEEKMKYYL
ncbi:citramalate synthase [Anaerotalea alkaliphila]|uniref:Citramalate synthase n=1 Tax=Anaerotalea alkaliphila TaxID=2662126 RepID=A0A7X5HVZ7_9FIRM|nr:citramalate synthase [Anaerotalea alkaliphila]NDL67618.1 citramalate synthase [Anaerotalea alkaliphila]